MNPPLRRIAPLLLSAVFALAGCSSDPVASEAPPIPDISLDTFQGPSRKQASAALERLRAQPESADANGEPAMLLQAYSQLEPAAILYERARTFDPAALRWAYYLGVVRAETGHLEAAATQMKGALAIDPDFLPARRRLADLQLELNQIDDARRNYRAVLANEPDHPRALFGLGRIAARSGDGAEAVALLERAAAAASGYGAAHYELALAYRDRGEEESAARHMEAYEQDRLAAPREADPLMAAVSGLRQDPTERINRAAGLVKQGLIEPAVEELKQALVDDPELVQVHINLLILYGRLGRTEEAEAHYQEALTLNADRAELHYNYGVLKTRLDDLGTAEKAFRKALEANPNHAPALHNLAQFAERARRFEEAESLYRRAVNARPDYRLANYHLGRLLLNLGRTAEAIQALLKTTEPIDEQTPEFLYGLAGAYARSGDRRQALRYGEQARSLAAQYRMSELAEAIDRDLERLR